MRRLSDSENGEAPRTPAKQSLKSSERKGLAGIGQILKDIDGDDTRSKIRQRFFYYRLWSTVEDLMANDKAIKGKVEKLAIATAKVRPGDVRLMLGNYT